MKIDVLMNERAFLVLDGRPVKYLAPGRYGVLELFKQVKVEKLNVTGLVAELDEARLALVPAEDLRVVALEKHERAVVYRRGRPVLWLGAGVHQVWTVDRLIDRETRKVTPLVRVEVLDTSGVQAPLLQTDVAALAKGKDYVEAIAPEGSVVVRYVDGQLDAVLSAGRHAAWNTTRTVQLAVIDLRDRLLHVTGQEVMTKDRVTLRLNVSAVFRVADAKRLATVCHSYGEYCVSTGVAMRTQAIGTPSASAAICAITVCVPCPISCPPSPIVTVASSFNRTYDDDPAFGGIAGAFHIIAKPLPRFLCGADGFSFLPQSIAAVAFSMHSSNLIGCIFQPVTTSPPVLIQFFKRKSRGSIPSFSAT